MPPAMEADLERVVRHLAQVQWPFRLHATYDETIGRALDVFEKVNAEVPFTGLALVLRSRRDDLAGNIDRVKALGAGSRCSTAWHTRARTSQHATARPWRRTHRHSADPGRRRPAGRRHRRHPRRELQPLGVARTGWSPARRSGDLRCIRSENGSTARKRCAPGRKRTPGSLAKKGRKARSRRAARGSGRALRRLPDVPGGPDQGSLRCSRWCGSIVHGDGPFRTHSPPLPPASPDWSPVNQFGGYDDRNRPTAGKAAPGNRLEAAVAGRVVRAHEARVGLACDCWIG